MAEWISSLFQKVDGCKLSARDVLCWFVPIWFVGPGDSADWETLGMKLGRESGSCVLTAHSNLRDPDVLALGHWNVEVCLKTEFLREKKKSSKLPRKEGFISGNVTRGYFGFCSNLSVSAH